MTYAGFPSKGVSVGNPDCVQTHKNTMSIALRNPVTWNTHDRETACVKRKHVCEEKTDSISKTYLTTELFFGFFHVIKLVVPFWFRNTGTYFSWLWWRWPDWGLSNMNERKGSGGRRGGGRQAQWGGETPFPPISAVSYDVTVLSREDSWPKTMNSS